MLKHLINNQENIEENDQSKYTQSFLLTEFLDIKNNFLSKQISNQMLKIFNPSKSETEDIFEEEEESYKIFSLSNENQNQSKEISATDDNSSENLLNQKNNIVISEKLFQIKEQNKTKQEKIKFISQKRKNSDNNTEEFDNKKKDVFSIKKQNTNDTNEITKKNNEEKNEITKLKNKKHQKYQYRLDYYKKAFKVNCFKHLTHFLNDLIAQCNLPDKFKNRKIFKPNNESFTANAKEEDNYKFLSMSIKDIYCYVKDDNKNEGISLQIRNKEFINDIMKYNEDKGNNIKNISKEFENLIQYLNMTMEEYIKIYYNTNVFNKFCKEEKIKLYEEEFIKEKKFPMLKDYGFLKLIKMYSFNKNFSDGLKSIHSIMNGINSV